MFTVNHLDWTQVPPDNNTGIQFPIQLHTSGPLALGDAHVVQQDAQDLSSAALTVKGVVSNLSAVRQAGSVRAAVDGLGASAAKPTIDQPPAPLEPDCVVSHRRGSSTRLVALPDGPAAALPPSDE